MNQFELLVMAIQGVGGLFHVDYRAWEFVVVQVAHALGYAIRIGVG